MPTPKRSSPRLTAYAASPGLAAALRIAGLALEGRHHCGEDDAWNIAALIVHLNAADRWPHGDEALDRKEERRPAGPAEHDDIIVTVARPWANV